VLLHWLGTKAGEWISGGEAPALATLRFPIVPAPYEGRPWFLPMVGEYFRFRDRMAIRGVDRNGTKAARDEEPTRV
jgi:hypothetical protein